MQVLVSDDDEDVVVVSAETAEERDTEGVTRLFQRAYVTRPNDDSEDTSDGFGYGYRYTDSGANGNNSHVFRYGDGSDGSISLRGANDSLSSTTTTSATTTTSVRVPTTTTSTSISTGSSTSSSHGTVYRYLPPAPSSAVGIRGFHRFTATTTTQTPSQPPPPQTTSVPTNTFSVATSTSSTRGLRGVRSFGVGSDMYDPQQQINQMVVPSVRDALLTVYQNRDWLSRVTQGGAGGGGGISGTATATQIRPQFRGKVVFQLTCGDCEVMVCQRGMKAILLADTTIELFSTDNPPFGVQMVNDDYVTRNCSCRIRDVACLHCGNIVGYHVTQPCKDCLSSCNNGHFWMFHLGQVRSNERFDAATGGRMLWAQLPLVDKEELPIMTVCR